jgi:hypothetical protein
MQFFCLETPIVLAILFQWNIFKMSNLYYPWLLFGKHRQVFHLIQ